MAYKANNILESYASGTFATYPKPQRGLAWAKEKVLQRTNVSNNIPLFYREVLRFFISKLGQLAYINSETELIGIKCIHSNPERAIAKLEQETNIILPIISISQNSSNNADSRRRQPSNVVMNSWWSEEKKRSFRVLSIAPRAVDIDYGINIWAKYKSNLDQVVEQVRLLFNPSLVVETPFSTTALSFIETESDSSSFELGDREERVIRRSFSVKVEGYIPNPQFLVTTAGEIEEFNADTVIY
tara:strand:- start:17 stop:745 length:729 start_codon:yes stop_codon:yes gene_type:complete